MLLRVMADGIYEESYGGFLRKDKSKKKVVDGCL